MYAYIFTLNRLQYTKIHTIWLNIITFFWQVVFLCILITIIFILLIGKLDEDEEIDDDEMPDNPDDQI